MPMSWKIASERCGNPQPQSVWDAGRRKLNQTWISSRTDRGKTDIPQRPKRCHVTVGLPFEVIHLYLLSLYLLGPLPLIN
jgi:hypothetical protein